MSHRAKLSFIAKPAAQDLCLGIAAPVRVAREAHLDQGEACKVVLKLIGVVRRFEPDADIGIAGEQQVMLAAEAAERHGDAAAGRKRSVVGDIGPDIVDFLPVLDEGHVG